MGRLVESLKGRKTYLVAGAIIAYQVLGHYLYNQPYDVNVILGALGLTALRAGVKKSGPEAP